MEEIKNKLSEGYDLIQKLNLKPTKGNMEILLFVLSAMKDAYDYLETINEGKGSDTDGAD